MTEKVVRTGHERSEENRTGHERSERSGVVVGTGELRDGVGSCVRDTRGAAGRAPQGCRWNAPGRGHERGGPRIWAQLAAAKSTASRTQRRNGPRAGAQRAAGKNAVGRGQRRGGPRAGARRAAVGTRRGRAWGNLGTRGGPVDGAIREHTRELCVRVTKVRWTCVDGTTRRHGEGGKSQTRVTRARGMRIDSATREREEGVCERGRPGHGRCASSARPRSTEKVATHKGNPNGVGMR